ncbi:MAG: septal ring lytic transglycosylase RlpA family protein [Nitrosomonadales bacterium]|nr:septal ring lytic transglycosylase RlpA family protein [Nitrosomonadales bacterium]
MTRQNGLTLIAAALLLTACGSAPTRQAEVRDANAPAAKPAPASTAGRGGYLPGDGPGANIPANLASIPNAAPRAEPLHPYANRPYVALGKNYTPLSETGKYRERGIASWYGTKFHGEKTSSGEAYDMYKMTAAHPTLPIPSYARITNMGTQQAIIVRINDRGPFLHDRIVDLSYTAAFKLGIIGNGSAEVEVVSIAPDGSVPGDTSFASSDDGTLVHSSGRTFPVSATVPIRNEAVTSEPIPARSNPVQHAVVVRNEPVQPVTRREAVAAPVRAEPVVAPAPVAAPAPKPVAPVATAPVATAKGGVYLQLGAFRSQQGAESFLARVHSEMGELGKNSSLYSRQDGLIRVHLGPYSSPEAARAAAEKLQSQLGFKPLVSIH